MEDNVQAAGETIINGVEYSYENVVLSINGVIYDGGTVDNIIPISEVDNTIDEDTASNREVNV